VVGGAIDGWRPRRTARHTDGGVAAADESENDGGGRAFRTRGLEGLANRDIFWLKDDSLEDLANLPPPDVIAAEIVEDLEAALAQFALIVGDLGLKE
jgi:hypothetical protein